MNMRLCVRLFRLLTQFSKDNIASSIISLRLIVVETPCAGSANVSIRVLAIGQHQHKQNKHTQ